MEIRTTTINDAWYRALFEIMKHGRNYRIDEGSFVGQFRREFEFVRILIQHPSVRPFVMPMPSGKEHLLPVDEAYVLKYAASLFDPTVEPNEDYSYGQRLAIQIEPVIEKLKKAKGTNQTCMTLSRPEDIFLESPPCGREIQYKVIDNKLNVHVFFRSNDLYNAFIANMVGIQLVKEFIAEAVGLEDGYINYMSPGLHLYSMNFDHVKELLGIYGE